MDLRDGVYLYAFIYDSREFLFQILLDLSHSVLLFLWHQCHQTVLPSLAHHSRAAGNAPCVHYIHFNAIRLWIYQNRSIT